MLRFPSSRRVQQVLKDATVVQQRCARVGMDLVVEQRVVEGISLSRTDFMSRLISDAA